MGPKAKALTEPETEPATGDDTGDDNGDDNGDGDGDGDETDTPAALYDGGSIPRS